MPLAGVCVQTRQMSCARGLAGLPPDFFPEAVLSSFPHSLIPSFWGPVCQSRYQVLTTRYWEW